ncbi:hypothetical protein EJ08DRAFT_698700 [Tothia fuscella]|uniref:Uncharacterized protein n=1 Tax=Tothia fuscella TaxID=1048955 RepID=A0A9P4NPP0_9PEZI|nr:hypothetical protein EJ08DRAFT_698700 [Tothia fuscella]
MADNPDQRRQNVLMNLNSQNQQYPTNCYPHPCYLTATSSSVANNNPISLPLTRSEAQFSFGGSVQAALPPFVEGFGAGEGEMSCATKDGKGFDLEQGWHSTGQSQQPIYILQPMIEHTGNDPTVLPQGHSPQTNDRTEFLLRPSFSSTNRIHGLAPISTATTRIHESRTANASKITTAAKSWKVYTKKDSPSLLARTVSTPSPRRRPPRHPAHPDQANPSPRALSAPVYSAVDVTSLTPEQARKRSFKIKRFQYMYNSGGHQFIRMYDGYDGTSTETPPSRESIRLFPRKREKGDGNELTNPSTNKECHNISPKILTLGELNTLLEYADLMDLAARVYDFLPCAQAATPDAMDIAFTLEHTRNQLSMKLQQYRKFNLCGLMPKFRIGAASFKAFVQTRVLNEHTSQPEKDLLLPYINLFFQTRYIVDTERCVMINPVTGRMEALFEAQDIPQNARERSAKAGKDLPPLEEFLNEHPFFRNYKEEKHPRYIKRKEEEQLEFIEQDKNTFMGDAPPHVQEAPRKVDRKRSAEDVVDNVEDNLDDVSHSSLHQAGFEAIVHNHQHSSTADRIMHSPRSHFRSDYKSGLGDSFSTTTEGGFSSTQIQHQPSFSPPNRVQQNGQIHFSLHASPSASSNPQSVASYGPQVHYHGTPLSSNPNSHFGFAPPHGPASEFDNVFTPSNSFASDFETGFAPLNGFNSHFQTGSAPSHGSDSLRQSSFTPVPPIIPTLPAASTHQYQLLSHAYSHGLEQQDHGGTSLNQMSRLTSLQNSQLDGTLPITTNQYNNVGNLPNTT